MYGVTTSVSYAVDGCECEACVRERERHRDGTDGSDDEDRSGSDGGTDATLDRYL